MRSAALGAARLCLSARFSHAVFYDEEVVLVADDDSVTLTGRAVGDLTRLLDGTRSAYEIAEDLHLAHRADLVYHALVRMEARGLLASAPSSGGDQPVEQFPCDPSARGTQLGILIRDAWAARVDHSVVLIDVPDLGEGSVRLLVTDDYLRPEVGVEAASAFSVGEPLLLGRLGWDRAWVGPYVDPMRTACVSCLMERLRVNLPARALVQAVSGSDGPLGRLGVLRSEPHSSTPALLGALLSDVAKRFGGLSCLGNRLMVGSRAGGPDEIHLVQRLPDCPNCGDPALTARGPHVRLTRRRKVRGSSGGYRIAAPQVTLERFKHLIDPLTGPVRFVERVEGSEDDCVHVYTANHAGGAPLATLKGVRAQNRDHSGGKGATDLDARASALCESLERHSALFRGREPERLASLDELGTSAIAPNEILHVSDRQYETRAEWNVRNGDTFQFVPEPHPRGAPISWTPAKSLVNGDVRYVPTAAVYLGFHGEGAQHFRADSNGLAAGNCLEEAILQAFLELVERDAVAIWWYNRLRVPGVDVDDCGDPYVDAVRRCYQSLGRVLWVLDLTSDLGIPCLAALSCRKDDPREDIIFGFGAHLDAGIALRRALTELNQMLPTALRSPEERRAQLLPDFRDAIEWWETATVAEHAYLIPDPQACPRRVADFARYETHDLLADVEHCVALASARDMDFLVCDLTRPDIGLSVARVIVPPLRHFWRRLAPGRIYDVPVATGRLPAPKAECDMNPISMFV